LHAAPVVPDVVAPGAGKLAADAWASLNAGREPGLGVQRYYAGP
jgi:hypothetical protein